MENTFISVNFHGISFFLESSNIFVIDSVSGIPLEFSSRTLEGISFYNIAIRDSRCLLIKKNSSLKLGSY